MKTRLVLSVVALAVVGLARAQDGKKPDDKSGEKKEVTTASGLKYVDEVVGTGQTAKKGDSVSVHYVGTFKDGGREFDSSKNRGRPFTFTLGQGEVIKGWDEGVAGMKVGGKRKLIIPYQLAYGENGRRGIPPKADLLFDVELLKVGP
jgi:FKBP-type peptidyl-prolyl cis-trans isomerase